MISSDTQPNYKLAWAEAIIKSEIGTKRNDREATKRV